MGQKIGWFPETRNVQLAVAKNLAAILTAGGGGALSMKRDRNLRRRLKFRAIPGARRLRDCRPKQPCDKPSGSVIPRMASLPIFRNKRGSL
jgi:hypothetical protein